jgi:LysR family glycine cleavage system transcriptional activator
MALVPSFLIAEELKRGELAVAFDLPMESANAYYLVYPEENLSEIALNVFKEWLLEEAKGYQR